MKRFCHNSHIVRWCHFGRATMLKWAIEFGRVKEDGSPSEMVNGGFVTPPCSLATRALKSCPLAYMLHDLVSYLTLDDDTIGSVANRCSSKITEDLSKTLVRGLPIIQENIYQSKRVIISERVESDV